METITALETMHARRYARRPPRALPVFGAALAALAVSLATSSPAAGETAFGVALNYSNIVDDEGTGAGVDVHFGPRLDLAVLVLTTELSGGYHDFGGPVDPSVYRGMAGGRLGLGIGIRPSVFAHMGVGHLRYDEVLGTGRESNTDFAWDLGAGLDFTLVPLVDLGVLVSYNALEGDDDRATFEWLQAGAHVTFVFDGT